MTMAIGVVSLTVLVLLVLAVPVVWILWWLADDAVNANTRRPRAGHA